MDTWHLSMQLTLMKSTSSQDLGTALSRYVTMCGRRGEEGTDRGGGRERDERERSLC